MARISLICIIGAVFGTYTFITKAMSNLRESNDSWNPAVGGFIAGSMIGLRKSSWPLRPLVTKFF